MGLDDETGDIIESMVVRGRILLSIILDTSFLGIWLAILWLFDLVTKHIKNSGDLEWHTAKVILGVATLMCICLFVFWDLRAVNLLLRLRFARHARVVEEFPSKASPAEE
jgi:hypothetical protein